MNINGTEIKDYPKYPKNGFKGSILWQLGWAEEEWHKVYLSYLYAKRQSPMPLTPQETRDQYWLEEEANNSVKEDEMIEARFMPRCWSASDNRYYKILGIGVDRTELEGLGWVMNSFCTFEAYTGVCDKDNRLIYEGDIVVDTADSLFGNEPLTVRFEQGIYYANNKPLKEYSDKYGASTLKITGNIHGK